MPFDQVSLDKSFNQARGIFDKFAYRTGDSVAEVTSVDYFAQSRFAEDPDWENGVIEAQCLDGYVVGVVSGGTMVARLDSRRKQASSIVAVDSQDDLPAPSGSSIQLADNTCYEFSNGVTLTDVELIWGEGTVIRGCGTVASGITFTTTGACITSNGKTVQLQNVSIEAPNCSEVLNCTGSVLDAVFASWVRFIGAPKLGSFTGIAPVFAYSTFIDFNDGFSFFGAGPIVGLEFGNIFMESDATTGASANFFDFGSSQFLDLKMNKVSMNGPGASRLKSSVSGANIINLSEAEINECSFSVDGTLRTIFDGFPDGFQTNNWSFKRNNPLYLTEPSRFSANIYLLDENTITVASSGTFYEIGTPGSGAWVSGIANKFELNAAGYLTYTGDRDIECQIFCLASVTKVGGGSNEIEGRIAINFPDDPDGIEDSKMESVSANFVPVPMEADVVLSPGDTIRPIFSNNDSTSNIRVAHIKLSIRGR